TGERISRLHVAALEHVVLGGIEGRVELQADGTGADRVRHPVETVLRLERKRSVDIEEFQAHEPVVGGREQAGVDHAVAVAGGEAAGGNVVALFGPGPQLGCAYGRYGQIVDAGAPATREADVHVVAAFAVPQRQRGQTTLPAPLPVAEEGAG